MRPNENSEPASFKKIIDGKEVIIQPADGVEMTSMLSIFIGAFKELDAKIDKLEEENSSLKSQIEKLSDNKLTYGRREE